MKRREFITLLGGATAWPLTARAQQTEQMRRMGVLMIGGDDSAQRPSVVSIEQRLRDLGWIEGRNIRIDVRWSDGDLDKAKSHAKALAESSNIIVTQGAIATKIAQEQTGTIPIVFWLVPDPVGLGLVPNLAQPGSNVTGFTNLEWSIGSKWLELLREFKPSITRTALLFNPDIAPYADHFMENLKGAGSRLGVAVSAMHARNVSQIETAMIAFADGDLTGLLDSYLEDHRQEQFDIVTRPRAHRQCFQFDIVTRPRAHRQCFGWLCRRGGMRLRAYCLDGGGGRAGCGNSCWQSVRRGVYGRTRTAAPLGRPWQ